MITTVKVGALEYLTADNIATPHCFTTRFGGVSTGHLASLNLGTHRGDDPENVLQNFRIIGDAVGFSPETLVLTTQTHTDIVRLVGAECLGAGLLFPKLPECDALITCEPGVALAAFTADCTPVLLWDTVTGAVGAVHAGWRGTAACIAAKAAQKMVEIFDCDPKNIHAAIGPNIAQCCFQTDADVPQAMLAAMGSAAAAHIRQDGSKYYVNLKELNALQLRTAGVESIEISQDCTVCQCHRYWSHRKVGQNRGSQAAIIVCKEAQQ